jgi:polysaccharide export outer membrane protein
MLSRRRPALRPAAVATVASVCFSILVFAQRPPNGGSPGPLAANPPKVEAPKVAGVDNIAQPVDPRSYIIGPEDIIGINVWRENEFTRQVAVRPDGKITLPLINDVAAEGLTPERLAAQLAEALSEYINSPQVTVSVLQVNSKKFYISGEVNRPGTYPLVVPTRIGEALNQAAGFRDFAKKSDILILRGSQRIKFNWNDYVKGKNLDKNIFLENGDTILVP